ncbi:uncharacterized protein F4812DRAFT_248424 [Daldinia caldariorum]|uniref:uncharacterized protein n=1 Tax=Daldinia caldariorum TaxID=326644 RepID=UPI0020078953|nr:uncharacterized protein F4812DRAFT_248424 [Daldinia caldariorum]KAI1463445.1 hypothetical protein F4812DRAFT_248424 [Daldinia caldariorum]
MAPNLESIRDLSARMNCFGGTINKDKDSTEGDKPSEIPNQSITKRSPHQAKVKSLGPRHRPVAPVPKKENNDLLPPPQTSSDPRKAPGPSSNPSATLPSLYHPISQLPAAIISYPAMLLNAPQVIKKSASSPSYGFNSAKTPAKTLPHQDEYYMASSSHSKPSQGPGKWAEQPLYPFPCLPPYQHTSPHLYMQPIPPSAYNNSFDPSWGIGAYVPDYTPIPHASKLSPGADPLSAQAYPLPFDAWPKPNPSVSPPGPFYDQQMLEKSIFEHEKVHWPSMGNGFGMINRYAQPQAKSAKHETEIDAARLEDKDESTDLEQDPENTAMVEAALEELNPLLSFVRKCLGHACAGCHKKKSMDYGDIVSMTATWAIAKGPINLGSKCQERSCKVLTCLGCGKACKPSYNMVSLSSIMRISGGELPVQWCCDDGRLAAIWALACGWEVPNMKFRADSTMTKVRGRGKSKGYTVRDELRGANFVANAKGTGYGGEESVTPYNYFSQCAHSIKRSMPKSAKEDVLHENYFRLLAFLLPSDRRSSALDASPPSFLTHLLSRSPLLEKSAMMLGSGSIDDASVESQLHDSVLDFFDALGSHPATADLAYANRNLYHEGGGNLLEVSLTPEKSKGRIVVRDTGKSLLQLLGSLAAQSDTVLRHAQGNPGDFENLDGQCLLMLSRRLSQIYTEHTANMQRLQTAMDITEEKPDIDFSEWHRENCVRDAPDDTVLRNFAFAREVSRETSISVERGRMKRLITEVSTLRTSLPEGIFICHGSSRLDIMRVLIIGPKHTPYEHGMFEFDLYCSADYPKFPPKMCFKTPNGSRTRFNPNLYHDGKICLSLLGTWAGEPWRADQSTLLQVLVSIQSMIFCEEPWYNEPGRERLKNKAQSDTYNKQVRTMTMQYAQLPWIKSLSEKEDDETKTPSPTTKPIWKETIDLYLRANKNEMLDLLAKALEGNESRLKATANTASEAFKASGCLK